jgi:tetratricopeptide (TPR) repeat protein
VCDEVKAAIDREFDEVRLLEADRKYEECLCTLDRIEKAYGGSRLVRDLAYWRGVCYYKLERYDEAIIQLTQAKDLGRSEPDTWFYLQTLHCLGRSYYCSRQWQLALEVFDEAEPYLHHYNREGFERERCEFHHVKGSILNWLDKHDHAVKALKRAKKILADYGSVPWHEADISLDFAQAYTGLKHYRKAYRTLCKINVDDLNDERKTACYLLICSVCNSLEKYPEMLEASGKLITIGEPESLADAYHYAGRANYYLAHDFEAVECFRKSSEYATDQEWIGESNRLFLEELRKAGFE